jgi:phosphoribosylformylglycinamidine synthase
MFGVNHAQTMTQAAGKFNAVARKIKNCSPAAGFFRILPRARMKAIIVITPKKAVLDPQGKTVQNALAQMGYTGVTGVHIGKYIEIDLAPGADKAAAQQALNDAAHKFLSNPVIEDYKLEIE